MFKQIDEDQRYLEQGLIIPRREDFIYNMQFVQTAESWKLDELSDRLYEILQLLPRDNGIRLMTGEVGVVYLTGSGWSAALQHNFVEAPDAENTHAQDADAGASGTQGGYYLFWFSDPKERMSTKGYRAQLRQMNAAATAVGKLILERDPYARVTSRRATKQERAIDDFVLSQGRGDISLLLDPNNVYQGIVGNALEKGEDISEQVGGALEKMIHGYGEGRGKESSEPLALRYAGYVALPPQAQEAAAKAQAEYAAHEPERQAREAARRAEEAERVAAVNQIGHRLGTVAGGKLKGAASMVTRRVGDVVQSVQRSIPAQPQASAPSAPTAPVAPGPSASPQPVQPATPAAPSVPSPAQPARTSPRFCWKCGHPLSPGARFCGACGAKVPD